MKKFLAVLTVFAALTAVPSARACHVGFSTFAFTPAFAVAVPFVPTATVFAPVATVSTFPTVAFATPFATTTVFADPVFFGRSVVRVDGTRVVAVRGGGARVVAVRGGDTRVVVRSGLFGLRRTVVRVR